MSAVARQQSDQALPIPIASINSRPVGTATLFDRSGAFGSGMTTAVSNPAAQIDFANGPFPLRIA